jgi:hypothetical protein
MKKIVWVLMLIALILVACSGPSPTVAPAATGGKGYIAKVDGAPASARVGIFVEGTKFAAYVCSLDDAFNQTSARWYTGDLDANGGFQGVSSDGVEFKVTVKSDQFSGTLINTAKKSMSFNGTLVPSGGNAGLYRGLGKYGGEDIVVGAVSSSDGSFASTVQVKGAIKFISPVANEPVFLPYNTLGVKIGRDAQQVETKLVTTLQGLGF